MALPLKYNFRNVLIRWRSTLATILGVALVVAVYVLVQSLAIGLEKSSGNTGDPRNVMVVRKGSTAESSSQITREQVRLMQYWEEIARDDAGRVLLTADVLVLINLPRRADNGEANVLVRGISPVGMQLRPQVTLVEGRWFTSGKREVVASRRLARRFANLEVGGTFRTAGRELTVVGHTDGGSSAFDSELWMDTDECRAIFDRDYFSSVLVRARDDIAQGSITNRLEAEKRLPLRAMKETAYYASQTRTREPIMWLGYILGTAMSVGAVFSGMNTMYASVGSRTREIGTLRVLGYRRRSILAGFLIEGALLAFIGGLLGCVLALPMHGYSTGTISFETFSETVFQFQITPGLAGQGLVFAVIVGLVGSFLPALRASRLPVIAALKSV